MIDEKVALEAALRLEISYTEETGRVPIAGQGLGNTLNTLTGEIMLDTDEPEAFQLGYRVEELSHFFQLRRRGWLGRQLTSEEIREIEDELAKEIMPQSGFKPYNEREYYPHTNVPRPHGVQRRNER